MSPDAKASLILGIVASIILPSLFYSLRAIAKWTRVEMKLDEVVRSMEKLVKDKDSVHLAIQQQIHDDRSVTDRRLRWLEEHLWSAIRK